MKAFRHLSCVLALGLASACVNKGDTNVVSNNIKGEENDEGDAGRVSADEEESDPGQAGEKGDDAGAASGPTTTEDPDDPGSAGTDDTSTDDTSTDDTSTDDTSTDNAPASDTDPPGPTTEPETPATPQSTANDSSPAPPGPTGGGDTPAPSPVDEPEPPDPVPGENSIPVSTAGWVDARNNAVGVTGPFFTFSDVNSGGTSQIDPPCGDGACFATEKICVSGKLAENDEGWAAVGMEPARINDVANAYDTELHDVQGFGFVLTGPEIPNLRFAVLSDGLDYCTPVSGARSLVDLDSLVFECWRSGNDIKFDRAKGITQLRWIIPAYRNSTFDFCIEDLTAFVGDGIPKFEAPPFVPPPIEVLVDDWEDGDLVPELPGWGTWLAFPLPAGSGEATASFVSEADTHYVTLDFGLEDPADTVNTFPAALWNLTLGSAQNLRDFGGFSLTYRAKTATHASLLRVGVSCEALMPGSEGQVIVEFPNAHTKTEWTTIGAAMTDFALAPWTTAEYANVAVEDCLAEATVIDITVNPDLRDGEEAAGGYSFDSFGFW